MSAILLPLSNAFTRVGDCVCDVFTKVVTVNYHVGGATFSALQYCYLFLYSFVSTVLSALSLALEDLVVFLVECSEVVSIIFSVFIQTIETIVTGIVSTVSLTVDSIFLGVEGIVNLCVQLQEFAGACLHNLMLLLSLLGRSVVMLGSLFSQTIYIMLHVTKTTFISLITNSRYLSQQALEKLYTAPYEVYLGLVVVLVSTVFLSKVVVRKIQESNITVESVLSFLLYVLSTAYIYFIRSMARLIGLLFTIVEVTVNNIRLPMFSHAGESDEESDEEDRESSVDGEERRKLKRFDLLANAGMDEGDSMEAELYRQVQREREDKLCVVCVDKMKCVMMLPCRHLCVCERCWRQLESADRDSTCPLCRKPVQQIIKAYL